MATTTAATLFGTSATADNVIDWAEIAGKPAFKAVATTGAYADLTGTPTLGTAASKDTGTAAGQVMVVGGDGKLPVVDGSNLTNVAALTAVTATTANAVAADVVTNAGLANMPAMRIKGAIVAGDPVDLNAAQIRQVIGSDHPGVIDMFIRADGAVSEIPTQALAAGSVTDATLEDMPGNTVKGALVTGNPGNLTPSQLRQIIGSDNPTDNTRFMRADGQLAVPPGATGSTTATLIAGQVTTTELADNAATNAKLADMPSYTIKMRNAATAGDAQDVGPHQLPKVASPALTREITHTDPATGEPATSTLGALAAPVTKFTLSHTDSTGTTRTQTYASAAAVPATWNAAFPSGFTASLSVQPGNQIGTTTVSINKKEWFVKFDSNSGVMALTAHQSRSDVGGSDGSTGGAGVP
jgi:hypothetical protein